MEYTKGTAEVFTIAGEMVKFLLKINEEEVSKSNFVGKMVKLLPLLYLKTALVEVDDDALAALEYEDAPDYLSEDDYNELRLNVEELLGSGDSFLTTNAQSDTPVLATISENLADLYQSLYNFVCGCKSGEAEDINLAVVMFVRDFRAYWGAVALEALKALHQLYVNEFNVSDGEEE